MFFGSVKNPGRGEDDRDDIEVAALLIEVGEFEQHKNHFYEQVLAWHGVKDNCR